jgi:uncharacterized DUF497 family protein
MADPLDLLAEAAGFEWDEGNSEKNWLKHKVSWTECEEVFFNQPLLVASDVKHSPGEPRFYALGQTDVARLLFLAFTIRNKLIRVISARDASRRERKVYRNAQDESTSTRDTKV